MKRCSWLCLLFFVLLLCLADALIEPSLLHLRKISIPLPEEYRSLDGIKIVHISDIHLKNKLGSNEAKVIEWAKQCNPDLIAMTGDFVEKNKLLTVFETLIRQLPEGAKFAVFGNWEHWVGARPGEWREVLARNQVRLLANEWEMVATRKGLMVVAGADDVSSGHADLHKTLIGCPRGYRILLTHGPQVFDFPGAEEFNLVLAGHSHHGQIRLPVFGAVWLPFGCGKYDYGVYHKGNTFMYVTSGVGWSIIPMRFLARPEVVLIELKSYRKK